MPTDVYFSALGSVRDAVAALGLDGISPSNVKVRMLPVVRQVLDTLPCVIVCPSDQAEEVEPFSFEDDAAYEIVRGVDVVQVAANAADFSTNLGTYLRRSEQARRAFGQQVVTNVPGVFRIRFRPWAPLDRSKLNQDYAYAGLTLLLHTVDPREDN